MRYTSQGNWYKFYVYPRIESLYGLHACAPSRQHGWQRRIQCRWAQFSVDYNIVVLGLTLLVQASSHLPVVGLTHWRICFQLLAVHALT